ncbi:MAG: hypothetical protein R3267_02345 [Paenisporosarcina sp.]|nr:hypothetical protein [Paenisporosarcina sp.]
MQRIQLAIGKDDFSNILRMHFAEAGFDVLSNDAYHRNFLPDLLDLEEPHIVIIHDSFLPSETDTREANENELLQMLHAFRMKYNDSMRFVVLSEREKQDPFLRSLVAHNVLDIFTGRQIHRATLIEQLMNPPKFQNVAKFGVGHMVELEKEETELPEAIEEVEEEIDASRTFDVKETLFKSKVFLNRMKEQMKKKKGPPLQIETEQSVVEIEEPDVQKELDTPQHEEPSPQPQTEPTMRFQTRRQHRKSKKSLPKETKEAVLEESITIRPTIVTKERILGTVFIAVTSIGANVGSTHSSILLASYLQRNGFKVALVEGNESGDFRRLHELFGEAGAALPTSFTTYGIDHFPYSEGDSFQPYFHDYQFVVMDLGNTQSTPWFSEFFRAQKRVLVAGHGDWKISLIGDFIKKHGKLPFQVFVPFADRALIDDLHEIYEGSTTFNSLPFHRNPYEVEAETDKTLTTIYGDFIDANQKKKGKRSLWLALASILTMGILSVSYLYLF